MMSSTSTLTTKRDRDLQRDVLAELRWDPRIEAERVGVMAHEGIVTLTGHVPSYLATWAAEKAALRVAGVRAVANEIEVIPPGEEAPPDEAIAELMQRELRAERDE